MFGSVLNTPLRSLEGSLQIKPHYNIDGEMKDIGSQSFTEMMLEKLNGNMPGDYYKVTRPPRHLINTTYNDRAREGFEYWWKERNQTGIATIYISEKKVF